MRRTAGISVSGDRSAIRGDKFVKIMSHVESFCGGGGVSTILVLGRTGASSTGR
jgi:hypothetical protein